MFWRRGKQAPKAAKPSAGPPPGSGPGSGGGGSSGANAAKSGTEFLTGNSDLDRRTVEVLLGTIARVSSSRDLEALLVDIVDRSVELTGAERGFLILLEAGEPTVRVARSREAETIQENVRFSTSIVRRVLEQGEPMLATVQSDSDALELGRSVFDLKLRAVMSVPLTTPSSADGAQRGVLYVDSRAATREFSHRDLGLFAALSQHISIALENARLHLHSLEKARLEHSLELASAIQSGLMPPIPKDVTGFEVHGWYRPAERTSGDFFDFVKTRDGRLAVVIGDVSGHGIGPALITATAQASLRSYLRVLPDPASALSMLNQDLSERMDSDMFLTLLLLVFSDDGKVDVLNAGHHSALLVRKGDVICCDKHGAALGLSPEIAYGVDEQLQTQPGDVLLAFTDGLIETHAPGSRDDLFGEERVKKVLCDHAARGSSAEAITRALAEEALSFSAGTHEDDITLVVVRRL